MCSSKRQPCFLKFSHGIHPLWLCLSTAIPFPGPLTAPLLHAWQGRRGSQHRPLPPPWLQLRTIEDVLSRNWTDLRLHSLTPTLSQTRTSCSLCVNEHETIQQLQEWVDGSYRLICIQPRSSLNLSHARLSSVKRLWIHKLFVIWQQQEIQYCQSPVSLNKSKKVPPFIWQWFHFFTFFF